MNYPLIKKFLPELKIVNDVYGNPKYIGAKELEAELAKGVELFGNIFDKELDANSVAFALYDDHESTHSGLLIGYKPLESSKPVSREEIEQYLNHSVTSEEKSEQLLKRILKNGVK